MKNTLLIASALVITFSISSCKKDYTCECDDGTGDKFQTTITSTSKAAAKTACEGSALLGATTGCTLK